MSENKQIKEMDNETSMEYMTEMYGQVLSGIKILIPRLKASSLGRVLEIYAGLPFVSPNKNPQSQDEVVLLQGLIRLGDLRTSMLELVDDEGKVKKNG